MKSSGSSATACPKKSCWPVHCSSLTQGDITSLLQEVKPLLERWKVPVTGIISDGEETIGSAVAFVFPEVPHQRCQFHYLKDATAPLYDADRHAQSGVEEAGARGPSD
jgi:hypothetical protein